MTYNPYPHPSYQGPQAPMEGRGTNGLAIASMVLGICGLLFLWVIGPILATIFGHVSLNHIRRNGEGGRGFALTGVILGWIGIAVSILVIVLIVAGAFAGGSSGS